jgi:hypothetical protein
MKNEQSLKLHNFLYLLCLYILDISDIFRHFQTISDNIRHFQTVFRDAHYTLIFKKIRLAVFTP